MTRITCRPERKARQTADIRAGVLGLPVQTEPQTGENDRLATCFLPPDIFEAAADAFFAAPDASFRGWETARAAQARIGAATRRIFADAGPQERILMVGHGAVGTLLRQGLRGEVVARHGDQPAGGGCRFALDPARAQASPGWLRMADCLLHPPVLASPG